MPELPEVQTVVDSVAPRIAGRAIRSVRLFRTDIVQPEAVALPDLLRGRTIQAVKRRGKRIVFTLDDGNRFFIHLGMTGRLTIHADGDPSAPHTHLIVNFNGPTAASRKLQLRFSDPRRFGGVWWVGTADCDQDMGPEPLAVRPRQLLLRLARTARAIKSALLDQSVLAGLGNIYVDESLFAAKIHPLAAANTLTADEVGKLNRAIKSTLRRALRHRGSTLRDYRDADGAPGGFQKLHRVYAREGKPCSVCKNPIQRIVLGGRSTHFCPTCQTLNAPAARR